jgi:hypothetical protein
MDFREAESETMDLDKGAQDRDSGRLLWRCVPLEMVISSPF